MLAGHANSAPFCFRCWTRQVEADKLDSSKRSELLREPFANLLLLVEPPKIPHTLNAGSELHLNQTGGGKNDVLKAPGSIHLACYLLLRWFRWEREGGSSETEFRMNCQAEYFYRTSRACLKRQPPVDARCQTSRANKESFHRWRIARRGCEHHCVQTTVALPIKNVFVSHSEHLKHNSHFAISLISC